MDDTQETFYASVALIGIYEQALDLAETGVQSVNDLLIAEEFMDAFDAGIIGTHETYLTLCKQSFAYLRSHPDLLEKPWVRNGGAVFDMTVVVRKELGVKCVTFDSDFAGASLSLH